MTTFVGAPLWALSPCGMFAPMLEQPLRSDLASLRAALRDSTALDALALRLSDEQWSLLAGFLFTQELKSDHRLLQAGDIDRHVYFVESGQVSVHAKDSKDRIRMAMVGPGSVIGEGAFLGHWPRRATAHAHGPCKVWVLSPLRFGEMAARQPALALDLTLALGRVMAQRLLNRPKRVAVT